jgi:hypothetical protein
MANDPLHELRETLEADRRRAAMLPSGPVKRSLNKKLRDMDVILQVVGDLPENDAFRVRVEALARRMSEMPSRTAEGSVDLSWELAYCARIARSMRVRQHKRAVSDMSDRLRKVR